MKKLYIIGLVALAATIIGLAWAEQMTFSTYYPAPYGVYRQFTTTSKTTLATNTLSTDAEAMVGIGTLTPAGKLDIYDPGVGAELHLSSGNSNDNNAIQIYTARPDATKILKDANAGSGNKGWMISADGEAQANPGRLLISYFDDVQWNIYCAVKKDGNVGIGTASPNSEKGTGGYLEAKDVYLSDTGKWASEGGGSQTNQAVGITNISNSTGAWVNMPNMSITTTTTGGNILLLFSAGVRLAVWTRAGLRFDVDGTKFHLVEDYTADSEESAVSMQYLVTSLSAGSHTFKVQWRDLAGTIYQDGATYPRVFTIIKF